MEWRDVREWIERKDPSFFAQTRGVALEDIRRVEVSRGVHLPRLQAGGILVRVNRRLMLGLLATSFAFGVFGGCGGDDNTSDDAGDATTQDVANDQAQGADGAADAGVNCAEAGSHAACQTCCKAEHPEGGATFAAAVTACACDPAKCFDACAPTCTSDAAASQSCVTCVTTLGSTKGEAGCQDQIGAACTADPDCQKYFGCDLGCPP